MLKYDGYSHCHEPIGRYYLFPNLTGIDQDDFRCPFLDTVCDACFDTATRSFHKSERDHLAEMDLLSWLTFGLTSIVTAASAVAEIRDIKLCEIAAEGKGALGWRVGLFVLQSLRQFCFLPVMLILIPQICKQRGGDPVSMCALSPPQQHDCSPTANQPFACRCLNTVAILFLLEVDNQVCEGRSRTTLVPPIFLLTYAV